MREAISKATPAVALKASKCRATASYPAAWKSFRSLWEADLRQALPEVYRGGRA
jgi:hypothetical protein